MRNGLRENLGMLRTCRCSSPLGTLTLAAEGSALVGVWMEGQAFFGEPFGVLPPCGAAEGVLAESVAWLQAYFAGAAPDPSCLPLAPRGSAFRRRVWRELQHIPYGQTLSYGALAARVGSSPRAVGGAVGHNPISIIIPCHRIIGSDGALGGYAGGAERKARLLAWEHFC